MRQISPIRPDEKLRGVKRRLRAVDRWAESYQGFFPVTEEGEKYWHCKLPVLDRLVAPPTTNQTIQAHCVKALLRATKYISLAKPQDCKCAIVCALITYPNMFGSEVCVFFDRTYYESFFSRNNEWQSLEEVFDKSLLQRLDATLPDGFYETGFILSSKDEWEDEVVYYQEQWWSYREQA
jgi:hypothetical protein